MKRPTLTDEAIRDRLFGAGFARKNRTLYERLHDRDQGYAVQVHVAEAFVRIVAVRHAGHGEREISSAFVDRSGATEMVLDKIIDRAREAYAAINHHRNGGK